MACPRSDRPCASKLPAAANIADATIEDTYKRVLKTYKNASKTMDGDTAARGPLMLKKLNDQWRTKQARARKAKTAKTA